MSGNPGDRRLKINVSVFHCRLQESSEWDITPVLHEAESGDWTPQV